MLSCIYAVRSLDYSRQWGGGGGFHRTLLCTLHIQLYFAVPVRFMCASDYGRQGGLGGSVEPSFAHYVYSVGWLFCSVFMWALHKVI